jgi:hypothetical protein
MTGGNGAISGRNRLTWHGSADFRACLNYPQRRMFQKGICLKIAATGMPHMNTAITTYV